MLIRITGSSENKEKLGLLIEKWSESSQVIEEDDKNCVFEAIIQPSKFREITTFLQKNYTNTAPEIVEQSIINKTVKFKKFKI